MGWRVETVTTGLGGAPFLTQHNFQESVGTPTSAVDAVVAFWEDLAAVIANDCTMTVDGIVTEFDAVTGQITGTVGTGSGAAVVGTAAGQPAALATQGLISWRTGEYANGREIRGRTFVPGVTGTAEDVGRPSGAYKAALNAAAATLISDVSSGFCIFSRTAGALPAVISGTAWSDFAVLRSRRE